MEIRQTTTVDVDEISAWLRLVHTPGVGIQTVLRLLAAFGLPQQIFSQKYTSLVQCVSDEIARTLLATPSTEIDTIVQRTLEWLRQPGHHLLHLADKAYPAQLLEMADPPPLLYVRGDPSLLVQPALAIVGSRSPSAQGQRDAWRFAQTLASQLTIVSGLALGIDAAAHRGALAAANGKTIAVVGTGVDQVYPAEHSALVEEISQCGVIVSEYPLGAPPLKHHFPRRNRLIAGLSLGVLVVEAAARSGSLITAKLAMEAGREVFAIPGSIHSPLAKGCHALIKQGAKLSESAADILQELRFPTEERDFERSRVDKTRVSVPDILSKTANVMPMNLQQQPNQCDAVLIVGMPDWHQALSVDEICLRSGLDVKQVTIKLLELEIAGQIESLVDGRYRPVH